jgi:multidrug resistance efflux pump
VQDRCSRPSTAPCRRQQASQLAAQVSARAANAELAQNNYERAVALQGRGFVSKAEIDSKRAARDAANAQVRVNQAQLNATRAEIGRWTSALRRAA